MIRRIQFRDLPHVLPAILRHHTRTLQKRPRPRLRSKPNNHPGAYRSLTSSARASIQESSVAINTVITQHVRRLPRRMTVNTIRLSPVRTHLLNTRDYNGRTLRHHNSIIRHRHRHVIYEIIPQTLDNRTNSATFNAPSSIIGLRQASHANHTRTIHRAARTKRILKTHGTRLPTPSLAYKNSRYHHYRRRTRSAIHPNNRPHRLILQRATIIITLPVNRQHRNGTILPNQTINRVRLIDKLKRPSVL